MYQDSGYKALTPEKKVEIRAKMYDKYVEPSYKAAGLKAPDKKVWLLGTKESTSGTIDPKQYFESTSIRSAHDMILGAVHEAQQITAFGLRMFNHEVMASYGLDKLLANHLPIVGNQLSKNIEANKAATQKVFSRAAKSVQDGLNQTNFLMETHPREGFLASAPRWTGEQVVMLPFYEAVGSALGVARGVVTGSKIGLGTAEGPAAKGVQNLSKTLATSKIGQFVGRRLYSAANIFVSSVATGDSPKEAAKNTTGVIALETAAAPFGALTNRLAATALIKRWTANLIAMGGKPLAQEMAKSAISEEIGKGFGIENVPFGVPLKEGDIGYVEIGTRNTHMLGDIAVSPSESFPQAGHLIHEGEIYPYKDLEEQQSAYNYLAQRAEERRKVEDPVLHRMFEAEKLSADSIAMRHFGTPLRKMTPEQIGQVLKRRMELIDEAAYELPAHVPDLNKMTVEEENAKEMAESPIFGNFAAQMKAAGFPEINEITNGEQVKDIEKQTGITSAQGAVEKISKVRNPNITKVKGKITPEAFAQHRIDTNAYFKNPNKALERRAADGTLIGGRDKRSWNERLKAENTAEFIETLKAADGDRIKFENPYHRMLFHWSNRENLPQPVRDKLLREMKKISETGAKPRYNMTAKQFNMEADWALQHLQLLAQSGRLGTEKNIFASSKFGGPENWTPWQAELQTEVDKQEMQTLNTLVERHPEAKKALQSTLKKVQAQRFNAQTPEEWMQYNTAINSYLKLGIF